MRRGLLLPLLLPALLLPGAAPALADDDAYPVTPSTRADRIASLWKRDRVVVTDHAPRSLPPDAKARITAATEKLGAPVYVAVEPRLRAVLDARALLPLLRDRMNGDGVYIVLEASGSLGEALVAGSATAVIPEKAWRTADFELASGVGAVAVVERFAEVVRSGNVEARYRAAVEAERPKSATRKRLDAYERARSEESAVQWTAFGAGTAASAGAVLLFAFLRRRTRRTRR
ncbi:hypothetical protein [Actinomadura flavalba]|uniref:hypothetical protein n=1 Tax=Actinomadura flavalba TaxID=1120938 RepID=UPI00037C798C|nr:hypothetical protein [Actinomadura flavalba]